MIFSVPATIEGISTRVDKTLKITLSTQELPPNEAAKILSLHQTFGWMLFSENELSEKDIPPEPTPEFKSDKSPSERLRAVLYVYWETNTDKKKPFNNWYKDWIEGKIKEIKDYLPEKQA